jgi:trehalose 6-phosphate phosphatase
VAPPTAPDLVTFRDRAASAGILLDFDGTLSEIVARPELAVPVDGAAEVLGALAERYRLVAIVTGRRSEEVAERFDVPGVRVIGLYGLETLDPGRLGVATLAGVRRAAGEVPGAWVEDKGGSVAVHYRQAADRDAARETLLVALAPVAVAAGLEAIEGKMVVELVPPGRPLKGGAIERLTGEHALAALLYAGDDLADLDAFAALDRAREAGALAVKVAVRGAETPVELIAAADVVADRPAGLLELLRSLL